MQAAAQATVSTTGMQRPQAGRPPRGTKRAQFPRKLRFLFQPHRYKVAYGGRAGLKSWGFARALLILGARQPLKILCAREYQASIRDSVHALLKQQVSLLGLDGHYRVQQQSITGTGGTEIIFAGVKNDPQKIKSMEGIDICWVEEAQKVSAESWQVLIPTIRKSGSEIWVSFNPDLPTDPTFRMFVSAPPPGTVTVKTGWEDNPWLSREILREKDYLARVDKEAYDHVWGGQCRSRSDNQVLVGKCVLEDFEPGTDGWDGPYFGADWGFSTDPTALVKLWIHGRDLCVEDEAYGIGVELDEIPALFGAVPGAREHTIRADNSRPETISHIRSRGFSSIMPAEKWAGSIEDGVAFLRSFERIVIHPRCKHFEEESRLYSYKLDRAGNVLPVIADRHNHCMDAARYALEPLIRQSATPGFFFLDEYGGGGDMGGLTGAGQGRSVEAWANGD